MDTLSVYMHTHPRATGTHAVIEAHAAPLPFYSPTQFPHIADIAAFIAIDAIATALPPRKQPSLTFTLIQRFVRSSLLVPSPSPLRPNY